MQFIAQLLNSEEKLNKKGKDVLSCIFKIHHELDKNLKTDRTVGFHFPPDTEIEEDQFYNISCDRIENLGVADGRKTPLFWMYGAKFKLATITEEKLDLLKKKSEDGFYDDN